MGGFENFLENKRVDFKIEECRILMEELGVDPYKYIYESIKEIDPIFAENWWKGVKDFAGRIAQGAKQVFGGAVQGATAGYKQASDTVAGPTVKFGNASKALTDLVAVMKKPEFQNFRTKDGQQMLADYIQKILDNLDAQKDNIPQMSGSQINQSYNTPQNTAAQQNNNVRQNDSSLQRLKDRQASTTSESHEIVR